MTSEQRRPWWTPAGMVLAVIRLYQRVFSPMLGANCRFQPTCSRYTAEAIDRFGLITGTWLGVKRIARCQPLFEGGHDPVPPVRGAR